MHRPRTLRVLGTSVTQNEALKHAAEEDLGFSLDFITLDGTAAQRRGALQPASFDVYDQWFHDLDLIWPTGSLQGIDIERVERWNEITNLPHLSRQMPGVPRAQGGDPGQRLYVQLDNSLGSSPTGIVSMVPTVNNADGFVVCGVELSCVNSWGQILDPWWQGQAVLQTDAAIGCLDLLLALRARGEIQVEDIGNLSLEEVVQLTDALADYQRRRHFLCTWSDEAEAVKAMSGQPNFIGSLWWSGLIKLRSMGVPVHMVEPLEGYRGWYGGIALSVHSRGAVRDLAYEYINWWLAGRAGAVMARCGAYMCNPETVRAHLSAAEWAFWYEGRPASEPILDLAGNTLFTAGESRGGGRWSDRMSRVVVWDAVMDEHNYLVRRWEQALVA